jgi:hypothetical protein
MELFESQALAKNWPTATAEDAESSHARRPKDVTLTEAADKWETPQAHDATGPKTPEQIAAMRDQGAGVRNLNEDAANWLTPSANEDAAGLPGAKMQPMLTQQAKDFPTSHQALEPSENGDASSSATPRSPRQLNPVFVEWLMGWPLGWTCACAAARTAYDSREMESWRFRQQRRLWNFVGDLERSPEWNGLGRYSD